MSEPVQRLTDRLRVKNLKVVALICGLCGFVIATVFLYLRVHRLNQWNETLFFQIVNMRKSSAEAFVSDRSALKTLKSDLESTRQGTSAALNKAVSAERLARRVAADQREREQQVAGEFAEVKENTASAHTKISTLTEQVGRAHKNWANTQSQLDKVISELKKLRGDLGLLSGPIATNDKELRALQQRGERDYFKFNLLKRQPQDVADITLVLKKADSPHERFALSILDGTQRLEKKNKSINQPVQFYVPPHQEHYELIVNEVRDDSAVGYLAVPKTRTAKQPGARSGLAGIPNAIRFIGPKPVHRVSPVVPAHLKRLITAEVLIDVEVDIDPSGKVTRATPHVSTNNFLAILAAQAAQGWRFEPAKRDHQPVPTTTTLRFRFVNSAGSVNRDL